MLKNLINKFKEMNEKTAYVIMLFFIILAMQLYKYNSIITYACFTASFCFYIYGSRVLNKQRHQNKKQKQENKITKKNYKFLSKSNISKSTSTAEEWDFIQKCLDENRYIPLEVIKKKQSKCFELENEIN